ncbi:MAG: carbamoyltransferase HypF [Gemmatimonadales bacterium]|jgi:hydrogenase maturation protein HypF
MSFEPTPTPPDEPTSRRRLRVTGVVQGVGFRPFVYRLATELRLAGWVLNDASGVTIEIEGAPGALAAFERRLPREAPPLSSIESCDAVAVAATGAVTFEIRASARGEHPTALVSPDTATCEDCLRELADPADRRFRYPFINCTNCGPRFTIIRGIPYDRPYTTMAAFEMCGPCRAEYEDPLDRRFHAQPNACPECGPSVRLLDRDGAPIAKAGGAGGADPVARAAAALREGSIVAVKGLGGYHLACTAADEQAVRRLRDRKHREDKPFAVMVPDADAARGLVELCAEELALLTDRARPIVLARRLPAAPIAGAVAPGHRDLGLMLPYTPLHHLLLADAGAPLVMTSGNVSDEPIAYRDEDARERLAGIADLFLVHDRPIHVRTDDSVVRVVSVDGERRPLVLRRSRGFVPEPHALPTPAGRTLVACGAHLKNTFTVADGRRAWVGHHIGDLENYETLRSFEEGVAHFERLFEVRPEVLVHDLHPEYLSTKYARRRAAAEGLRLEAVQHHHAHLAACLAEHGIDGPALGVIFDGTGYGTDGTVWGGELLVGDAAAFERAAHLWPVRLPGGEAAIRQPWRMACAWLCAVADAEGGPDPEPPGWWEGRVDAQRWRAVVQLVRSGVASPLTTSAGRLFDAVSALCGVRLETTYEGQAAIELEMAASAVADEAPGEDDEPGYPLPLLRPAGGLAVLDARATVRAVMNDLAAGIDPRRVGRRFHLGVADGTAAASAAEARRRGLSMAVLSGGVFQNVLLLERVAARLAALGVEPLVPCRLPPNDGGISYGQAAAGAARLRGDGTSE